MRRTCLLLFLTLTLLLYSDAIEPKRVLLVFPFSGYSQYILGNALAKGLAKAGFEATIISAYHEKNPPKNYREIVVDGMKEHLEAGSDPSYLMWADYSKFIEVVGLTQLGSAYTKFTLEHPKIRQFLAAKNESFDAVIVEQFVNDALKGFASHFKAPLIVFSSMAPNKWTNNLVGNPDPPSYVPDIFMQYSDNMGFFQRMYNFIFSIFHQLNHYYFTYPAQAKFLKAYFQNPPSFDELQYNSSLVLLNFHESVGYPVPQVPNMINIGGFHIQPTKSLSKDLQDFLDNANEGVIYFSLGTNINPSEMSNATRKALLKALGSRREKVLWKWDEESLPNQPANVKTSKWFPQQEILNHPNTKLFITHCGLLSTLETTYFGVPVLGIPVFADQNYNAERAANLGLGRFIPFTEVNEKDLFEALKDVLENPKYRENVQHRSRLLRDRPVKPMDLAIYWVDYVIRHKGASHLRVAGVDLPLYKYLMLDVLVVLTGVIFMIIYVCCKAVKCLTKPKSKLKKS